MQGLFYNKMLHISCNLLTIVLKVKNRMVVSVSAIYRCDHIISSVHFSSVAQSCPTPCHPMDCSTPGLPVHHQLPEFTQTHVHWVRDAISPSLWTCLNSCPSTQRCHPTISFPVVPFSSCPQSFPASGSFPMSSSLHQVAKVLELQL